MMTNGLVVFQSDFGRSDGAVSAMHGVANTINRGLSLFEITHEIPHYNIWEASYRLYQVISYWPIGTVFVSIVDPGVGSDRKSIVAQTQNDHFIVTPDNGTLTHIGQFIGIAEVREIDEDKNRLPYSGESHTFHGRDIFAYVGAQLASGLISFQDIGPPVDPSTIIRLPYEKAVVKNGWLTGIVDVIDKPFGNIWTNISRTLFNEIQVEYGETIDVRIVKDNQVYFDNTVSFGRSFASTPIGTPLVYINSLDTIGIALNQESFAETFQIESGIEWTVMIKGQNKS
jgi:S-adenosylmethionine hydrolase